MASIVPNSSFDKFVDTAENFATKLSSQDSIDKNDAVATHRSKFDGNVDSIKTFYDNVDAKPSSFVKVPKDITESPKKKIPLNLLHVAIGIAKAVSSKGGTNEQSKAAINGILECKFEVDENGYPKPVLGVSHAATRATLAVLSAGGSDEAARAAAMSTFDCFVKSKQIYNELDRVRIIENSRKQKEHEGCKYSENIRLDSEDSTKKTDGKHCDDVKIMPLLEKVNAADGVTEVANKKKSVAETTFSEYSTKKIENELKDFNVGYDKLKRKSELIKNAFDSLMVNVEKMEVSFTKSKDTTEKVSNNGKNTVNKVTTEKGNSDGNAVRDVTVVVENDKDVPPEIEQDKPDEILDNDQNLFNEVKEKEETTSDEDVVRDVTVAVENTKDVSPEIEQDKPDEILDNIEVNEKEEATSDEDVVKDVTVVVENTKDVSPEIEQDKPDEILDNDQNLPEEAKEKEETTSDEDVVKDVTVAVENTKDVSPEIEQDKPDEILDNDQNLFNEVKEKEEATSDEDTANSRIVGVENLKSVLGNDADDDGIPSLEHAYTLSFEPKFGCLEDKYGTKDSEDDLDIELKLKLSLERNLSIGSVDGVFESISKESSIEFDVDIPKNMSKSIFNTVIVLATQKEVEVSFSTTDDNDNSWVDGFKDSFGETSTIDIQKNDDKQEFILRSTPEHKSNDFATDISTTNSTNCVNDVNILDSDLLKGSFLDSDLLKCSFLDSDLLKHSTFNFFSFLFSHGKSTEE